MLSVLVFALAPLTQYTLPPSGLRGDNTVQVVFARPELVRTLCGARNRLELQGCVTGRSMRVPNPCLYTNEQYARILCHELGHVNGWAPSHR